MQNPSPEILLELHLFVDRKSPNQEDIWEKFMRGLFMSSKDYNTLAYGKLNEVSLTVDI